MNCPHCHAALVADARFCPACGKATQPTDTAHGPPGTAPDLAGREIAGRYRILKKLGEGGMGAVYRGEQISLKRAIAIKLLRPELSANQLILRRFNAEAEAVAKLSHPNTVNIYDFGQDSDGTLFIAMEYIEGRSLREVIQREGPLSPARALAIASQIAASLVDAHAHSIVHRDLKPDNVMLQDRGKQRDVVRVLDFGIAKLRDDSRQTQHAMTQAGDVLGTPQYMAPEQIRGEAVDGRADIYALGCLIYEMVTGRLPYEAPSIMAMLSKHLLEQLVPPSQRRPELGMPPAVDDLVMRAMAKDPAVRTQTMDDYADLIASVLPTLPADPNRSAGMSAQAFPPPLAPPPVPTPAQFAPTPAPSQFAPTPAPGYPAPGFAPPGTYVPPPIPPTTPVPGLRSPGTGSSVPTSGADRAPKWRSLPLFIALGALALGAIVIGVWAATRKTEDPAKPTEPMKPTKTDWDDVDEPDEIDAAPKNPDDPWAQEGAQAPAPSVAARKKSIGTAATAIPKGARIEPPAGFQGTVQKDGAVYMGPNNQMIGLAPLYPGTNDPDKLAARWAKETGFEKSGAAKIESAGKPRDAVMFTKTQNGIMFAQIAVLYIEPDYRLVVMYQAPATLLAQDGAEAWLQAFFKNNVVMP